MFFLLYDLILPVHQKSQYKWHEQSLSLYCFPSSYRVLKGFCGLAQKATLSTPSICLAIVPQLVTIVNKWWPLAAILINWATH